MINIDVRNIQKTGNMHYVYLPTSWCKKFDISSDSRVSVKANNDGTLTIFPDIREKERKTLDINIDELNPETLAKLIIASYINPIGSFKIKIEKEMDFSKLLSQKKVISALEFVELDGKHITHESSIFVKDPDLLLNTMVKKTKNLINVMIESYNIEIIEKYEEEIDRSRLLITKSVISAMTLNEPTKLKTINLHYILLIAQELERLVDSLIHVSENESKLLKKLFKVMDMVKVLLENPSSINYEGVIGFDTEILSMKTPDVENIKTYGERRIKKHLSNISEVFFDWAINNELEMLYEVLTNDSYYFSSEIVAEELLARCNYYDNYTWDEEQREVSILLPSGINIKLKGNELDKTVELTVFWESKGLDDHRNIYKYVDKKLDMMVSQLKSLKWKIISKGNLKKSFVFKAKNHTTNIVKNINKSGNVLSEIVANLSFE